MQRDGGNELIRGKWILISENVGLEFLHLLSLLISNISYKEHLAAFINEVPHLEVNDLI